MKIVWMLGALLAWQGAAVGQTTAPAKPDESKAGAKDGHGASGAAASPYTWTKLGTEAYQGKQDDIHFVSPTLGWYVNGAGRIYRTKDGGATWEKMIEKPGTFFRCIAFLDEQRGFAGNIGPDYFPNVSDTTPLYRTGDGGTTWEALKINGDPVKGLCALEVVRYPFINAGNLGEKTMIVGGGRVGTPAVFIKSMDEGATWTATDMSAHCQMILDVHFFDDRHGVIAAATDANVQVSKALILTTSDGGATWTKVYEGSREFELTWKISFPTRDVGYVTIQSYNPDPAKSKRFVAKTTDGGKTWAEIDLVDDLRVRQFGVAFIDANTGWVGAMPHGFETTDGGATWRKADMGNAVNKIRLLRTEDGFVGYAIGVNVFKLEHKDAGASK
jgi:photosystem II stability/assembly factor-like uncharacterized protein